MHYQRILSCKALGDILVPPLPRLLAHHVFALSLRWRHNGLESVSNHQPHDCLLNCSFGCRSKKTSKLRVTGLCVGNSPVTGEFPAQMASNAENVSIWWRHHVYGITQREQYPCISVFFHSTWWYLVVLCFNLIPIDFKHIQQLSSLEQMHPQGFPMSVQQL